MEALAAESVQGLVGVLMFGKIGFILVFAYLGIRGMEKLKKSDAPKSSLSRDGIAERMAAGTRN
ncbi:MAG: hypothetical protein AAGF50_12190 [Pseudomonadota bacterium]